MIDFPENTFIPLDEYMARCNAHYYGQNPSIGAEGDFITAPEISQIFGELLGVWVTARWQQMGRPQPLQLIELGPGRGTLIGDMLRVIRQFSDTFDALEIHLVETSPRLREMQKGATAEYHRPVFWHDDLAQIPVAPFIMIANEFLDALPIRQFIYSMAGWLERGVMQQNGQLQFATRETAPPELPPLPPHVPGTIIETSPAIAAYTAGVIERLRAAPGSALFIDYGYALHDYGDTFQAISQHAYANPLENPGAQDLTAHVNFAALTDAARAAALQCSGPIGQGEFLRQIGLEVRAQKLLEKMTEPVDKLGLIDAVQRLTAPEDMGTLFKVICLSSPQLPPPEGFHASHCRPA